MAIGVVAESPSACMPHCHRRPYFLDLGRRPYYRGKLFGWLLNSGFWFKLCIIYFVASICLDRFSYVGAILRLCFILATIWGLYVSDEMHNSDLKIPSSADPLVGRHHELKYYRQDLLSISCIIATGQWLWAYNLGWSNQPKLMWPSGLNLLSAGFVMKTAMGLGDSVLSETNISDLIAITRPREFLCKLTIGLQFVVMGSWQFYSLLQSELRWGLPVFVAYGAGFCSYSTLASSWAQKFIMYGPHEIFHICVAMGHMGVMGCDLVAHL